MSKVPPDAAFATRAVHAGLDPDPNFGSVIPAIHQTSTYAQTRARRLRRGLRLLALGEPHARRAGARAGRARGRPGQRVLERHGRDPRAHHGRRAGRRAHRHPVRPLRRHVPARRQGPHALGPALLDGRPDRPRRARRRRARRHAPHLGRDADEPAAERRRHRGRRGPQRAGARRGRQHVRDARQPAPARARRRRRRALDDEVPRGALRHGRRRGRRAPTRLHEQVRFVQNAIGAVPGPMDCFLVHRGLRTLHLRMQRARRQRRGGQRVPARGPRRLRRALAGLRRDGLLPPSRRRAHRELDAALHARRVARRRRVADRGPAGDDPPVRRGLRRRGARRPRAAVVRHRGGGGSRRGPAARARRLR